MYILLVSLVLEKTCLIIFIVVMDCCACDYCSCEIIGNYASHNTVFLFCVIKLNFGEQIDQETQSFLKIYFLQFPLCMYFILLLATFVAGQNSSFSRSCKCVEVLLLVRIIFFLSCI